MSTVNLTADDLMMQWDDDTRFPFVEDENCNITGYGHQDKATFAAEVNRYDDACGNNVPEASRVAESDISHQWAILSDDGEHLHVVPESTAGAHPVTTLWGWR